MKTNEKEDQKNEKIEEDKTRGGFAVLFRYLFSLIVELDPFMGSYVIKQSE